MSGKLGPVVLWAIMTVLLSLSCISVRARAPEKISFGGDRADHDSDYKHPPGRIIPAKGGDVKDLQRENRQLRGRNALLNKRLKDSQKRLGRGTDRIEDLEKDLRKSREKLAKMKRERDKYKSQRDRLKEVLDD